MTSFHDATAARRAGDGRYEVTIHPDYILDVSQAANGGYLIATLLRAVLDASDHPHPVATSAHFLSPGVSGPAAVSLDILKTGRTVTTTRASLVQDEKTIVDAIVTTAALDEQATTAWRIEPPQLPPVATCVPIAPTHPLSPGRRFVEQLDVRVDPATAGWLDGRPSGVPEIRAYFRLAEGQEPDVYVVALAIDAKPPATIGARLLGPMSTVQLTLNLRTVPVGGWLILDVGSRLIGLDWCDEEVDVWDSEGNLVAQSRQLLRRGRGKSPRRASGVR